MNSLNSILLEGNLTRDPVLSETPKGTSVCTFSIGSNRYYKYENEGQNEVSFFDIEVWARLAEQCSEHLKKGRGVRVVGRLKQDRWTDGEGKYHSRVKIIGEHVEFRPVTNRQLESAESEDAVIEAESGDEEDASVAASAEAEDEVVATF